MPFRSEGARLALERNDKMNPELRDACISVVTRADGPMTAAQIATAARGGKGQSAKFNRELAAELGRLSGSSGVEEWPMNGRSRIFWNRPFRNSVEDAFLKALDTEALNVSKAAKPVSRLLLQVSEERTLAELKTVAPQLATSKRVLQVAINRQSIIYLSFGYLERLLPAREAATSFTDTIVRTLERLQPGAGNYVSIDHLRKAVELRRPLDDAAIGLARKGKLVLARYDGPRPIPEDDKWNYIEDERGELFIGAAIPRGERVIG